MELLDAALNDPIRTFLGYPTMGVVLVGSLIFWIGLWCLIGMNTGDRNVRYTPGIFDVPVAIVAAWSVSSVYGFNHWEASLATLGTFVAIQVVALCATVPFVLLVKGFRKLALQDMS